MDRYRISERAACSLVGLSRAAYRYMPLPRDDEAPFKAEVVRLACAYGRYGYRTIAGMMRNAGWSQATTTKVARIWRQEGLKIPQKQPPRGRLWLNDGSCMRLRATHPNHVWSYDFVQIRDAYGGKIRMLTMIDEFSRKCLSIHCARRIGSIQVIEQLANAMEIFYSLKEAQIIVGEWVKHYNQVRPHSSLGYRPPAPQTKVPQIILNQPMLLQ